MPSAVFDASLSYLLSVAQFGLNWLIQSLVLAAAGLTIAAAARRFGAATQSAIYRTTLVAILVAPVATALLGSCGIAGWSIALLLAPEEPPAAVAVEGPIVTAPVAEVASHSPDDSFPMADMQPRAFDRFADMRALPSGPESLAAAPDAPDAADSPPLSKGGPGVGC